LIKYSALARYLYLNMSLRYHLQDGFRSLFSSAAPQHYVGNTSTDTSPARMKASLGAMDAFFRDLPELIGLPRDRIVFTVDGFRYPDGAAKGAGTFYDLMRRAFRERAEARGYEVIDMDPIFFSHFRQHGQRFEFPNDYHWNATAHGVVADAVLSSKVLARFPFQQKLGGGIRGVSPLSTH
jgi:hypothetical protein